jgi:hypothetical protein
VPGSPHELAEDEIILAWIPKLPGYHWESASHRFDCPECGKARRLSVRAKPGFRRPQWDLKCGCERELVAAKLADLGLISSARRARKSASDPDELIALALADIPPQSKYLGMLELAGMSTSAALDKLGVTRTNRYRVVSALRQNRRS